MFGQSYGVFKLVSAGMRTAARVCGANLDEAENIGTYVGTYAGYFTALATADVVGGAGIAFDAAHAIDKNINKNKNNPKP